MEEVLLLPLVQAGQDLHQIGGRSRPLAAVTGGATVHIGEIDAEALKKTTLSTEPNTETLNFLNLNRNSACQLFDEMILACGEFSGADLW